MDTVVVIKNMVAVESDGWIKICMWTILPEKWHGTKQNIKSETCMQSALCNNKPAQANNLFHALYLYIFHPCSSYLHPCLIYSRLLRLQRCWMLCDHPLPPFASLENCPQLRPHRDPQHHHWALATTPWALEPAWCLDPACHSWWPSLDGWAWVTWQHSYTAIPHNLVVSCTIALKQNTWYPEFW